MLREHASKYDLMVSADRTIATVTGTIELGITRNFTRLLDQNPAVRTVVLGSSGGNIYEARGLAVLISARGLDTRVDEICSSACTTVYIGGQYRSMRSSARLGFHQYRIDADYTVYNANPQAEQKRDRELYAKAGVKAWFLDRMFNSDSSQMWFPTLEELLAAGVVNEISAR